jgi:hypothetical protein
VGCPVLPPQSLCVIRTVAVAKVRFFFLLCCRLLSSPFVHFSLPSLLFFTPTSFSTYSPCTCVLVLRRIGVALHVSTSQDRGNSSCHPWLNSEAPSHMTSIRLAASCGVEIHRLERPSIRAGAHARHLILSASVDASRKAQRRQPHLYDGVLGRPGKFAGRLYQYPDRGMMPHQPSAYISLSTAPAGITPVSRKRHSAMSNLRATATMPIRRKRLPPLPKRCQNQLLKALSG